MFIKVLKSVVFKQLEFVCTAFLLLKYYSISPGSGVWAAEDTHDSKAHVHVASRPMSGRLRLK
jgi:hypothetical protein